MRASFLPAFTLFEASLELDFRITQSWARAADEVVFSHALVDEDRVLEASPLIGGYEVVTIESLGIPAYEGLRDALYAAGHVAQAWESRPDRRAPGVVAPSVRGGTAILADHAACPFRAFARHRLGDRIRFHGSLAHHDIVKHYQGAALVVNPSLSETFGISIVEGLACGVPVVGTRVGGMLETITDDVGRAVPAENPVSVAASAATRWARTV